LSEKVYKKLRVLLDRHPFGCPPAPEIIEILKILFTEEEAKVALGLGFRPLSVQEIARSSGVDPQKTKERLESLANKGVVFAREKDGVWGYALVMIIYLFENPYRKGIHDKTIKKLTPLWKKYLHTVGSNIGSSSTSISRVIPIQREIEHNLGVLSYEKIYEMIDRSKVVGIAHCACRELEQKCDAPRESCMIFGATCTYLVERGFARYISKEEMKKKLREYNEAGLVHQVNNTRDRFEFVCNCCPCCCILLRTITEFDNPRAVTSSAFLPINDSELCIGCGKCADERCPMKAIDMADGKPSVEVKRCIGCGLCATGCLNEAMYMEKYKEIPKPPKNLSEMGLRMLKDERKIGGFMEIMMPIKLRKFYRSLWRRL
jgi:coenzyme F420-reducing hydrogenase gamma subunit